MQTVFDNPTTVPAPAGNFSHVVSVATGTGRLLFVSGQIANAAAGEIIGIDDMTAQSHAIMQSLKAILSAHGGSLSDVVNIRTFMTDMDRLGEYGSVRQEYLPNPPPSSTTVEVTRLFKAGALLEVEVVAAVAP